MAKFSGRLNVRVNGAVYQYVGDGKISPAKTERTTVKGDGAVEGYMEKAMACFVEFMGRSAPGYPDPVALHEGAQDFQLILESDTGEVWTASKAWSVTAPELDMADGGKTTLRFECADFVKS